MAQRCIGQSFVQNVSKEFGCAESIDRVYFKTFGKYIGGGPNPEISTSKMYYSLLNSKDFIKVSEPKEGTIIISPSGSGNGKIANGHVGCCGLGYIMSNNSLTGRWDIKWSLNTWKEYYGGRGGFPVYFFDVV